MVVVLPKEKARGFVKQGCRSVQGSQRRVHPLSGIVGGRWRLGLANRRPANPLPGVLSQGEARRQSMGVQRFFDGAFTVFQGCRRTPCHGLGLEESGELVCAGCEPWQQLKQARSDHFSVYAFSLSSGLSVFINLILSSP